MAYGLTTGTKLTSLARISSKLAIRARLFDEVNITDSQRPYSTGDGKRPFHLLRWFSVLALTIIVLISVASAFLMSQFLTNNILQRDVTVAMEFVNSVVRAANAKHADEPLAEHTHTTLPQNHPTTAINHYLMGRKGKIAGHHHDADADLDEFFRLIGGMPDVLRANIYAKDGTIVWSSNRELIGTRFGPNDDLDHAFSGELVAETNFSGQGKKIEHLVFVEPGVRYVENYFPIWTNDYKTVVGVVEIYKSPRALFETVDMGQRLVWFSAAIGGFILYAALFWIVRRAHIVIQRQQKQLVESETMTALGEMTASVAHGIRNPLASVRSTSELGLEDESMNVAHESFKDIIEETDRLEHWVRDLLTFSRPANGEVERVQINDVISSCLEGFIEPMRHQDITLVRHTYDHPLVTEASATAMVQVFNGLISNALHAMPDGGRLTIADEITPDGQTLILSFSDTGHGIPKSDINKVFQPFFTRKATGMGIGLSLAKRVVERSNGTLDMTSVEGQGTTVTVRLPVAG